MLDFSGSFGWSAGEVPSTRTVTITGKSTEKAKHNIMMTHTSMHQYVWVIEKGYSDMYGSWGGRCLPKKVIQLATRTGQGILACFQEF